MPKSFDDMVHASMQAGKSRSSSFVSAVVEYRRIYGKAPFTRQEIEAMDITEMEKETLSHLCEDQRKVKILENEITGQAVRVEDVSH